jgi:uncharacterized membrane protein YgdD (TMEM256/DUF423 family)
LAYNLTVGSDQVIGRKLIGQSKEAVSAADGGSNYEGKPHLNPQLLLFGALSGALGVALGAFGAHALRPRLEPERLVVFETAVRYQLIHALALLFCSTAVVAGGSTIWFTLCGWFFVFGSLLFSGSLYLLVFTNRRAWGAVAPLGGLALIAGWLSLAAGALSNMLV